MMPVRQSEARRRLIGAGGGGKMSGRVSLETGRVPLRVQMPFSLISVETEPYKFQPG